MREVFTGIKRTPYQSLAAFLVHFFSMFLIGVLSIAVFFFHALLSYIETRPQVTAYFQTATKEEDIFKIREELINSGKTTAVKYVSQKDALKIYQQMNKDNPLLLEMVTADVLPPSLEIYAKKPEYLPQIAEFLKKQPATDEVQFQKDIVDRLLILTSFLRKTSIIVFVYLFLMTIVVLITVFHFKISQKREEIELLSLLGATKRYILKPFVKEGVFLGFFSSLSSFLLILLIFLYFQPFLSNYLRGLNQLTFNFSSFSLTVWPPGTLFVALVFLITVFIGVSISFVSVYLASNRYLNR
jgi:cell division transport system permease protein